jgi:hypothetical protein
MLVLCSCDVEVCFSARCYWKDRESVSCWKYIAIQPNGVLDDACLSNRVQASQISHEATSSAMGLNGDGPTQECE